MRGYWNAAGMQSDWPGQKIPRMLDRDSWGL
jgi:hypothetical protein